MVSGCELNEVREVIEGPYVKTVRDRPVNRESPAEPGAHGVAPLREMRGGLIRALGGF